MAGANPMKSPSAQAKLRQVVDELEDVAARRGELTRRVRRIKKRAGDQGFDPKALGLTLRLRALDREKRGIVDLYLANLGGR